MEDKEIEIKLLPYGCDMYVVDKMVKLCNDYEIACQIYYKDMSGVQNSVLDFLVVIIVIDKLNWQEPATLECLQIVRYNDIILKKEKRF